jgi:L-iditol 2-dehydrogenase
MKAVVIHGKEDFRYEDVADPKAGQEEIVVKVARCGICAIDPKIFHGSAFFSQTVYDHAPIVAGHEYIGEVVELGPGAKGKYGLKVGDKAIAEVIIPCGECYFCKHGRYNLCNTPGFVGLNGPDGSWAEYMKFTKGSIVWKVPAELPWEVAVAIEPLACGIHGTERANIQLGDIVVVMGSGPIGLLMLQAAKLKNPMLLIAVDRHDEKLNIAKELGADLVLNPQKVDVVKKVKELSGGLGCDVVLEVTGNPKGVEMSVDMLRRGGRMMEYGVFTEQPNFDFSIIVDKELEIMGALLGTWAYPQAIKFLTEGLVRTDKIVTHNFPRQDWKKAIETSEKHLENSIKVTMTP